MNAREYQDTGERETLRVCIIPPPPAERRRLLFAVHVARKLGLHRTLLYRALCRHADAHLGLVLPRRRDV